MLSWAIAGTSFISETMAAAIASSPGSRIVAVSGHNPDTLTGFAKQLGIAKTYTDYDAMLRDPQVDVVYIGLPNHVHCDAVAKAAASGKMILSEKSLTTTMQDAQTLAKAVRDTDMFFWKG